MSLRKPLLITAATALVVPMTLGAPMTADAASNGRCTTGKGVLAATRSTSPNVSTNLHQVFYNTNKKVKGNTVKDPTYHFHHVVQPRGAIRGTFKKGVSNSIVFQTKRGTTPPVTVVWRAKKPYTINSYMYASCTIQP